MANLSKIYLSQNKLDFVKEMTETVYARRERIFGKDHPNTVVALETLRKLSYRAGLEGSARVDSLEDQLETERTEIMGG
ncbi:uncharacterized protein N7479_005062 [Penicillium vulpinum]|uniref:uncharacterized protein n=1 Tax=Penicillium vulpinum TaxID=29845 RepID=UPI0025479FAC|nr:uncharacterized protein N7479_005062 [Penicillium vulpinum]KAJ5965186.1 hypothetical protein N7479_005062 [Penicillium vulpinum]